MILDHLENTAQIICNFLNGKCGNKFQIILAAISEKLNLGWPSTSITLVKKVIFERR